MNKKNIICLLLIFSLSTYLIAKHTIVVVKSDDKKSYNNQAKGFVENLDQTKFEIEILNMRGKDKNQNKAVLKKINNMKDVKVIYSIGTRAAVSIARKITNIPQVFSAITNWRKWSNVLDKEYITGIEKEVSPQVVLAMFNMVSPQVKKLGIIYNPENSKEIIEDIEKEAKMYGLEIVTQIIHDKYKAKKTLKKLIKSNIEAFWYLTDPTVVTKNNIPQLLRICNKAKLITLVSSVTLVKEGYLVGIDVDNETIGSQAAGIIQTMYQENTFKNIPVAAPMGSNNFLNAKVAQKLGLKISDLAMGMLQVIE